MNSNNDKQKDILKENNEKGDGKMLEQVDKAIESNLVRDSKTKKTNLLSLATEEKLKHVNELSKNQSGISSLTYKRLYGEE